MNVICQDCGLIDGTMSLLPVPQVSVGRIRGIASIDGRMICRKCNSEKLIEYRKEQSG